ncbi:MAG: hypothetical protein BWY95_01998 [Bacteroidetes bacterium ADurb.BinA104]|nr:MAG: hypothetical protein BWY95_01998 [Bacteroidetes bacterium ADurb.BinA104]
MVIISPSGVGISFLGLVTVTALPDFAGILLGTANRESALAEMVS